MYSVTAFDRFTGPLVPAQTFETRDVAFQFAHDTLKEYAAPSDRIEWQEIGENSRVALCDAYGDLTDIYALIKRVE